MKKIPFDIKYRPEIEVGKYKVRTRLGLSVRIICWDTKSLFPIIALISESETNEFVCSYTEKGKFFSEYESSPLDLFLVQNKNSLLKHLKECIK